MSPVLKNLRVDYGLADLAEAHVATDPVAQFMRWFDEALTAKLPEPDAMTLATASPDGMPSARVVLLKGVDASGFTFFTNYTSRKGRELDANPRACLCFFWQPMERQVRVEGTVGRVSRAESEAYFCSRPMASQLGAWVSRQSNPIASREVLEQRAAEIAGRFAGGPVPLPDFWGGYRVAPQAVEFWQGRPSRLHDRLLYTRAADGAWKIERLSP